MKKNIHWILYFNYKTNMANILNTKTDQFPNTNTSSKLNTSIDFFSNTNTPSKLNIRTDQFPNTNMSNKPNPSTRIEQFSNTTNKLNTKIEISNTDKTNILDTRTTQFPCGGLQQAHVNYINKKCSSSEKYDSMFEIVSESVAINRELKFVNESVESKIINMVKNDKNNVTPLIETLIMKLHCIDENNLEQSKDINSFFRTDEWARKINIFLFEKFPFIYNKIETAPNDLNYTHVHLLYNAYNGNLFENEMELNKKNVQLLKDFLFIINQQWNKIIIQKNVLNGIPDNEKTDLKKTKVGNSSLLKTVFIDKLVAQNHKSINLRDFLKNPMYGPIDKPEEFHSLIDRIYEIMKVSNYTHYDLEARIGIQLGKLLMDKCGGEEQYKIKFENLFSHNYSGNYKRNLLKTTIQELLESPTINKFEDYKLVRRTSKKIIRNPSKKNIKKQNSKKNLRDN